MNAPRSSALQTDINVTPLVDVCLVLLIIFMVVMPILVRGVPVQLPETKHAAAVGEAARQLPVTVKEDGTVYVDGIVLLHEQVAAELQRLHTAHPNRPVVVRGDKRVQYGAVVDVLDACRAAGFENVGLISAQRN